MNSSKILLFSDAHIHAHKKSFDRLKDCLKVLDWVFETAKAHNIKDIVFAGDLFQDRQKIDVATYSLTFDAFIKYCDGSINLWLLLGNHDMWYHDKWDISSVLPFSALPNVTVVNKACTLEVNGKEIDFLPYVRDPIEHLKQFEDVTKKRKGIKILVGHLAVHGAELNALYHSLADVQLEHDGDMVKVGPDLFTAWDQVFLGHYHGAQEIENIEYIGSPLELTFGEAFQEKHIIIYDLKNGNKEYITNDFSPKHLIVSEDNIHKYEVENNFVRISVENRKSVDMLDLKKRIQEKKPGTLEIIQKPKKEQKQVVEDAKAILNKEDEMLETYVKEVDTGDMEKPHLVEIGKFICAQSTTT
jgi:DNA repair exonuclease SbcCD nuclease subunit